jgi:RNA polymerase sigma-70 factor (ECF subfamily)
LIKSDQILVQEIKNGRLDSFDELMIKHQQAVFQVAKSFTKDTDDAFDLSQTIFLKAYENLKKFRGDSQFKTWLMRITYNEGNNWLRRNRKRTMQEEFDEHRTDSGSKISQEDEYLASENRAALLRCLFELNTKYRLAVILRYFENYSIKEIAETLDCSEGVIKNMLFRSLEKLRSKLYTLNSGAIS